MASLSISAGPSPDALPLPHFPSPAYAVLWRNWGLVPLSHLAAVLEAGESDVLEAAAGLGLPVPPVVEPRWLERGYLTLIRMNWSLLTLEQICTLLGWPAERLEAALRDEDFLWIKLGTLKPRPAPLALLPLKDERAIGAETNEAKAARWLRDRIAVHFPQDPRNPVATLATKAEPSFGFLDRPAASSAPPVSALPSTPLRLIYAYAEPYGDALADPGRDPYPDEVLHELAAAGVNGVWWPVSLFDLAPPEAARLPEEERARCAGRLQRLNHLAKRIADHGLGLYLYFNEPRALPSSAKLWEHLPERKGIVYPDLDCTGVCTSAPGSLADLAASCERVFREAPALAGALAITMSEHPTHCHSHRRGAECPRCSGRTPAEVVGEVLTAMEQGIRAAKPEARLVAWDWAWDEAWVDDLIDRLPLSITLMSTSEWGIPLAAGENAPFVRDYSISHPGPGKRALAMWARARKRGLRVMAKVQVNASWELAALPWLPVADLVVEHIAALKANGVDDLMLSWTVGGYHGGNLPLLSRSPEELASEQFGPYAPKVREAWRRFSNAFRHFPFSIQVVYVAPHNAGPSNLLYATPTGFKATMVMGFPYDDLERWRDFYTEDELESRFDKLCSGWSEGLQSLAECSASESDASTTSEHTLEKLEELQRIAQAALCHFQSALHQIRFVRWRADASRREECRHLLDQEVELAKQLHALMKQDSRIGFEAANHYFYTPAMLQEKVLNALWLKEKHFGLG